MRLSAAAVRGRLDASPIAKRILSGSSWSILSSLAAQMIGLLTMVAAARLLGAGSFGRFVILQSTLATVGLLSGFGVGATAIRYLPTHRQDPAERIGHILGLCQRTILVFGLSCSLGFLAFSGKIATDLLHSAALTQPLAIALSSILFLALDGFYKSALIGLEKIKAYAVAAIGGQILNLAVVAGGAVAFGLIGAATGLAVSALAQALLSRLILNREMAIANIGFIGKGSAREWRVLRDFALPSLLGAAMVGPAHWVCQIILAGTAGNFHQIAIFGIAMQWFNAILLLPTAAGRVLTPVLIESMADGKHERSWKVLQISVGAMAAVAVPCAAVITLAAPLVMATYGRDFIEAANALRLAIVAGTISAVISPVGNVLIARNKAWLGLVMNFGWACIYVTSAYYLRAFGALGITAALTGAYVVHSCWVVTWSYRNLS